MHLRWHSCMHLFVRRRSPLDITLCSQISNEPISTIQPIDDAEVEIYFSIEDVSYTYFISTVVLNSRDW